MRQRARVGDLTVCYSKKQIDISFSYACPVIDNDGFCYNIVKVVCGTTHSYFDNVMTKFMINNRQMHEKLTSIC